MESKLYTNICRSLLPDRGYSVTRCLELLLLWIPSHGTLYPQIVSQNNPPLPQLQKEKQLRHTAWAFYGCSLFLIWSSFFSCSSSFFFFFLPNLSYCLTDFTSSRMLLMPKAQTIPLFIQSPKEQALQVYGSWHLVYSGNF